MTSLTQDLVIYFSFRNDSAGSISCCLLLAERMNSLGRRGQIDVFSSVAFSHYLRNVQLKAL